MKAPSDDTPPLEEMDSRDRPPLVRHLLGAAGLTRSALVDALAAYANKRKTAYNVIYQWLRAGRLVERDGLVHMVEPVRRSARKPTDTHAGEGVNGASRMPAQSAEAEPDRPRRDSAGDPSGQPPAPAEAQTKAEAGADQPPIPDREDPPADQIVDRLAITSDGCLIVWFTDGRQQELCHRGTAAAHRLLSRNADLLRSD